LLKFVARHPCAAASTLAAAQVCAVRAFWRLKIELVRAASNAYLLAHECSAYDRAGAIEALTDSLQSGSCGDAFARGAGACGEGLEFANAFSVCALWRVTE
jgi:hypothetical protein